MRNPIGRDCGGWDPSSPYAWYQCDPSTIPSAAKKWRRDPRWNQMPPGGRDDTRGLWTVAGIGVSLGLLALLVYSGAMK